MSSATSWKVSKEFPKLKISEGMVSLEKFGYKGMWKVGEDAQCLVEAALLGSTVLNAGETQLAKLQNLKRHLVLRCSKHGFELGI